MTATASPQANVDPLKGFMVGAFATGTPNPIPLVSTAFDVEIDAGLATVTTRRVFRNEEDQSIEATITFPVPVHATLFDLEARIDGRLLKAKAHRRKQAREAYEEAIDTGKTSVLHEEVLRGVHMLSVGHIPTGAEIAITATWATTLSMIDGRGFLRIPLTVGDIYGRSSLPDSDDLLHGGPVQSADLVVRSTSGTIELARGSLDGGRARVLLNAPIDLFITGWESRDIHGRAADGREVVLRIAPAATGEKTLDVAVLVDHSGSMSQACSSGGQHVSKHEAVRVGLKAVAKTLRPEDLIDIWEFDNTADHVGSTAVEPKRRSWIRGRDPAGIAARLAILADRLSGPSGGTEIGAALSEVTRQSEASDVVMITDGKSHALNVQALARTGRRFNVVLVGEDSLEANVGHLAALTGGDIFVTTGNDLSDVLAAAMASMRRGAEPPAPIKGDLRQIACRRSGVAISAGWSLKADVDSDDASARAVSAVAASLALPALDEEAAAALAEAEGLVTHLTSLLLVDEAGAVQEGIPAMRKVPLPTPRSSAMAAFMMDADYAFGAPMSRAQGLPSTSATSRRKRSVFSKASGDDDLSLLKRLTQVGSSHETTNGQVQIELSLAASEINWDTEPNRLVAGDLGGLDPRIASLVEEAARLPEVLALAAKLDLSPIVLILGMLAHSAARSRGDRSAGRVARAALGAKPQEAIERLANSLGI